MYIPQIAVPLSETPRFKKLLPLGESVKSSGRRRKYLVRMLETGNDS
jgi:hypothetical protein